MNALGELVLDQAATFEEKVQMFSEEYLKCCIYISNINDPEYIFPKRLYSQLITSSLLLEDLLDYHGAKQNKNWYFYRELAAAVRHLSIAGNSQKHVINRLDFYNIPDTVRFQEEGSKTRMFLTNSLIHLAPAIIKEAKRLNIRMPKEKLHSLDFPSIATPYRLDNDIDDVSTDQQKKNITKISSDFLRIAGEFEQFGFHQPLNSGELKELIPDKINEVAMRHYEMLVHNLQSSFDTYVINVDFNYQGKQKLIQFRGHFSLVFHLLKIVGRLLHFYERHLLDAGYKNIYKQVGKRLAELIDTDALLHCTVNYGVFYAHQFLSAGKSLAEEILKENIYKSSIKVQIPETRGFHCRPSLLVSKIVNYHGGQVELCLGDQRFDAGSVLDMQWAGGMIQNENIKEVVFEGDKRALRDIEILARLNYCEDLMGRGLPFPEELNYLK